MLCYYISFVNFEKINICFQLSIKLKSMFLYRQLNWPRKSAFTCHILETRKNILNSVTMKFKHGYIEWHIYQIPTTCWSKDDNIQKSWITKSQILFIYAMNVIQSYWIESFKSHLKKKTQIVIFFMHWINVFYVYFCYFTKCWA